MTFRNRKIPLANPKPCYRIDQPSVNTHTTEERLRILEGLVGKLYRQTTTTVIGTATTTNVTSDHVITVTLAEFSDLVAEGKLKNDKKYYISDQNLMYEHGTTTFSKTLMRGANNKWYVVYFNTDGGFDFTEITI